MRNLINYIKRKEGIREEIIMNLRVDEIAKYCDEYLAENLENSYI